ncbi:uncharacterized protein LOC127786816 [Diospyros lotus]|uniref:uncharacterized protein LOC127786816 n=1 Tax=Diospyros lotus TaxID=55363 RepID=UPI00225A257B|nr:uncharacterized protein LOC127786816 [Diospyros lotus]XP_052170449.1 uncharacterized protein LOC127786816 [Diospyros lotus]XP_052170450.1 uncharacterized protein LOC127786816 [Diospyros lotus]XP_052170451.1 uncharacterized protein LOC127786816 [Diospyros lotus]XP_052170452.1 uncharacterized protein LOC127786816 [Diospyros lotus]XP_052170453.1 uncharacterized protein LOC127786816 [Diospyros lotus]XP_052170454.1 uncharacterized protein LOC127786816 [Diospyros lotus]XP_052170455.1 uncharacte
MAAAEARAAWQRTANRCFVQEDAKRAPKLACCPSTPSSSKQVDTGPANPTDGHSNPNIGFIPLNSNPSFSKLPPESRWWMQLQPNHGYQKTLASEQLNALETEMETFVAGVTDSTYKASEGYRENEGDGTYVDDYLDIKSSIDNYDIKKKDPEGRNQELNTVCVKNTQETLKPTKTEEFSDLLEVDPVCCSGWKQACDTSSQKTEPWWRIADRDELASFVARRSFDLIENCDLPRPQNIHVKRDSSPYFGCFDSDGILPSLKDLKFQTGQHSSTPVDIQRNVTLRSACREQWTSSKKQSEHDSGIVNSVGMTHQGTIITEIPQTDPCKAQLLEALRHSQTRAREAEQAAKQAYAEKEDIIKLVFRQASHLFAYKQWFQLLQLENLYLQIKNHNQSISTLFPLVLPWMPQETRKLQKSWRTPAKGERGKRGRGKCNISKLAVAVALGLSLVGAGLLLGWTVAWMLPTL